MSLIDCFSAAQVHISTNHRAERDAEYQALSKSLGMKSFPETGFGSYADSGPGSGSLPSLVQSSPSLLQQMSQMQSGSAAAQLSSSGSGPGALKFPELSITKHEAGPGLKAAEGSDLGSASAALQIIPKSASVPASGGYNSCRQETQRAGGGGGVPDIQEQINMLRTMPDFMRLPQAAINTEEEDIISGEEMEEEDGSPPPNISHKVRTENKIHS